MSVKVIDPRSGDEVTIHRSGPYWTELWAARACAHEQSEMRIWINKAGGKRVAAQCLTCGEPRGTSPPLANFPDAPPEDPAIRERFASARKDREDAATIKHLDAQEDGDQEFWAKYDAYLQSPEWRAMRGRVLYRCQGACEGCGVATATEVHHMTYEHVFEEFLFELKGLCKPCHDRWHASDAARK